MPVLLGMLMSKPSKLDSDCTVPKAVTKLYLELRQGRQHRRDLLRIARRRQAERLAAGSAYSLIRVRLGIVQ